MKNCGRFVFYDNIYFFYEKPKRKQPTLRDMLPHFHCLYSHRPQLSINQRARVRSVIVKQVMVMVMMMKMNWKKTKKNMMMMMMMMCTWYSGLNYDHRFINKRMFAFGKSV